MLERALRRATRSSSPRASPASPRRRCARSPTSVATRRHAALDPHLALGGGRQPRRLAGLALRSSCSTRCSARSPPRAARSRTPGTSSCRGRSTRRRIRETWNELTWPLEYPLAHERDVVPAAALPQGGARQARRLLHPRLQPGLDQPRRLLVDRGAHRRGADRPARRADADLERDRLLRRLRAADGPRLRAPRPALLRAVRRPVDRLPPARAARGARAARASRSPTRARSTRARCGRRTSSGSSSPGASIPTARSASASYFESQRAPGREAHGRRVLRLDLRELGARPARARRGGGPDAARVHAPLRRLRDRPRRRRRSTRSRCPTTSSTTPRVDELGRVYTRAAEAGRRRTSCRCRRPEPDADGRRRGRRRGRRQRRCAASRRRAAGSSSTRARSPSGAGPSHALPDVHPQPRPPGAARARADGPASRPSGCPSRSTPAAANAKWLDEIAHTNPLWIHPTDAARARRLRPATSCASRPRSATSSSRPGSPRASGPASSPAAITWAAGSSAARAASGR